MCHGVGLRLIAVETAGSLIGDHYLLVASPRYITGQFNSHMASLLLLHADEAVLSSSRPLIRRNPVGIV